MLLYNDHLLSGTFVFSVQLPIFLSSCSRFLDWLKIQNQNQKRSWHSLASLKIFQRGFSCPLTSNASVPLIFGLNNALGSSDTLSSKVSPNFLFHYTGCPRNFNGYNQLNITSQIIHSNTKMQLI